jgi:hypothetical protein
MRYDVLGPDMARHLAPALATDAAGSYHVYRVKDGASGWQLSVATHAAPGSGRLSLGGFRIAPKDRATAEGYDNDREALGLAIGMEEKIRWSRMIHCGAPRGLSQVHRLVGGKCVLLPTDGARIGEANDAALLDFAVEALGIVEREGGFHVITGQDLGHGMMSDGVTPSLAYLHQRFAGSVLADTSKPTGEGNLQLLLGALRALDIDPAQATVGLVGLGNIGEHIVHRLHALGSTMIAIEPDPVRAAVASALGVRVLRPDEKSLLLALPMDALVVNARGGSLDRATVATLCGNERLRVICGSENLAMPDQSAEASLRAAHKAYFPTEFGGMMGYLTAVEEYLCAQAGAPFDVRALFEAALHLERAGYEVTAHWKATAFEAPFEQVTNEVFGALLPAGQGC